jgi:hypothetical protein
MEKPYCLVSAMTQYSLIFRHKKAAWLAAFEVVCDIPKDGKTNKDT